MIAMLVVLVFGGNKFIIKIIIKIHFIAFLLLKEIDYIYNYKKISFDKNMNYLEILKRTYPTYNIKDCSAMFNNAKRLKALFAICENDHNIIAYAERNKNNDHIFDLLEKSNIIYNEFGSVKIRHKNDIQIINNDNYIYFTKKCLTTENEFLRLLDKNLIGIISASCCICTMENDIEPLQLICPKCQSSTCLKCLMKIENKLCPICRYDMNDNSNYYELFKKLISIL